MIRKINYYDTLLELFPDHEDTLELYFNLTSGSDLEKANNICWYYCEMDFW